MCSSLHFCHGSSGLAQMYRAMYDDTLNFKYYEAYHYWINETCNYIDKEIDGENMAPSNPTSLLEGWVGAGLVLAEYITEGDCKTKWAQMLLLS
ncbi:MAG: lanthionine synthetase LanC family protein [Ferruginibacter sp.]|nr:hypothetical protein [Ferruginibacter sp.]